MGKIVQKTKRKYRKSKNNVKRTKDKNGKAHCGRCGAYVSK